MHSASKTANLLRHTQLHAWCAQLTSRRREWDGDSTREDQRLVLIGYIRMHHRRVPIPFNVTEEALVRRAPNNGAHLAAGQIGPSVEALKALHRRYGVHMRCEIHKSVTKTNPIPEIMRQIDEVI